MALFQPLLLAVDDLAQKLGLNLSISAQSGTIPHDGNTWSLTSLGVPAVIAGLLYWYLKPSRPSKQRDATGTNTTATKDSSSTKKMAPRPADGQIKVVDILIHPLKSCRGVSLQECNFTPDGLENDRRYCIIDATNHSLMTAREVAKMVLITPRIEGDKLIATFPGGSGVKPFTVPLSPTPEQMATWEVIRDIKFFGEKLDGHIVTPLDDASGSPTESLSAYFGKPCVLVYKGVEDRYADPTVEFPELKATVKYQDAYPVLVLSEESMEVVEKEIRGRVGTQGIEENWREDKIHYRRFRPNIVLSGGGPFAEDDWEEISVGDPFAPKFQIVNKAARCLLPNVSPETGERDKAVPYKVIMKFRMGLDPKHKMKPCIGSNSVPQGNGTIRVGETVYIKKMIGEEPIPVAPPAEESEVPPPLEQL